MRFLFITYYLPPEGTTAAQRIWRWMHSLYQQGHELIAIGKSNNNLPPLESRPLPPGTYTRTIALDYRIFQKTNSKSRKFYSTQHTGGFRKAMDSFPLNLFIGEGALLWIILAYFKAARAIRTHQPNAVITSYRPAADHIIGWLIKTRFPTITWIADFRDMPPLQSDQVFWKKFQLKCWQLILKKADQITAVSQGIAHQLSSFNPHTFVLYNAAYPNLNTETIPIQIPWPQENITLLYTGSWFPSQSLEPLFQVLKSWDQSNRRLQVVYCGKDEAIWITEFTKHNLQHCLIVLGLVDASIARYYQSMAHFNMLFTWTDQHSKGILTSKLFDYLSQPTPLLCFTNGTTDPELREITHFHSNTLLADNRTPIPVINQWITNNIQSSPKENPAPSTNPFSWPEQISPWLKSLS